MNIKEIMLDDLKEPIDIKIGRILRECNVSAGLTGYRFLKTAIEVAFLKNHTLSATKDLYPYIATKEGTSTTAVERSMRHAIDKAWALQTELPSDVLEHTFKYSKHNGKYRPTNTVFVQSIAEEIRMYSRLTKHL